MFIKLSLVSLFLWTSFQPCFSVQVNINSPLSNYHSQQHIKLQYQHDNSVRHSIHSADSLWRDPIPDPNAKNFLTIQHPPKKIEKKLKLKLKYQCTRPMMITVMIDGYENDDGLLRNDSNPLLVNNPTIIFQSTWHCSYMPLPMEGTVSASLPNRFTFRPNVLMPKVSTLEKVLLKAFMVSENEWKIENSKSDVNKNKLQNLYKKSKLKLHIPLKTVPPLKRPPMKSRKCLSWMGKLTQRLQKKQLMKSHAEDECLEIVRYPVVMSEEPYGVVFGFYPFYNNELQMVKNTKKLRFTLSQEVYLFSYCEQSKMCSFFHHLDNDDTLEAPILVLSSSGNLLVQVKAENNNSYAQVSSWKVPLRQWVKINYIQTNSMANITAYYGENYTETLNFKTVFNFPLKYNEANGYMMVGGSVYCKNINGIVAYSRICRNKALPLETKDISSRKETISERVLKSFKKQQRTLKKSIKKRWQHYANQAKQDVCVPYFIEIVRNATKSHQNFEQCPAVNYSLVPSRLDNVEEILNDLPSYLKSKDVLTQTKVALYKKFLLKLENPSVMKNLTSAMKLLKQATRLGHGQSHFLLYSIYKNGVGTEKNLMKARIHLLLGAQLGDNLCLKTLAYSHLNGVGGFPKDINLAFFYYFNLAHKTQQDLLKHHEGQATVNSIRLTEEKQVKEQLSEGDDVFEWMKLQAAKGAFSAQRNMAGLLYWGQKGLQRNLEAALEYYREAAKGGDPTALYDYGVALIKGHGGEVDVTKGIEAVKQAAEVQNPAALNTMGWYYSSEEVNYTKAAEYFEKSDKLGSIDAAYNLGYMYQTAKYPGKDRDMKMAFTKYYRAASGGHIEASLQVAYLCATGIENFIPRNPEHAVEWAKYLSERNPTMGELVREGLQAFRKQHWSKSLFIYMSLAETGFEVAQYNTAFLCETNEHDVTQYIKEECAWKNWNISSRTRQPNPYALNKMGDFYYYGHGGEMNLNKAIDYYADASKLKYPQALFNLANIMEVHGDVVTNDTLLRLSLPKEAFISSKDTIVHLYKKCTEIDSSDSSLPCHIALMRTQLVLMWERTSFLAKVLTVLVIITTTIILILLNMLRKRRQNMNDITEAANRIEDGIDDTALDNINNINDENLDDPTVTVEERKE